MMTIVTHVHLKEGAGREWDAAMRTRLSAAKKRPGWVGGQLLRQSDKPDRFAGLRNPSHHGSGSTPGDPLECLVGGGLEEAAAYRDSMASPYPFRLDPFLAVLSRASAFWAALSKVAAGFTLSRSETTSSKARRYRDRALLCLPGFVFTCPV